MYSSSPDVIADAHTLPFSSNTFDTIILMEVAEHLNSPSTALKEVKRVLKPGGEIIFTVPYIYPTHDAPYDYQRWTQYGLENIAKESGLSINSIINYGEPIETGTLIFCLGLSFQTLNLLKRRHPLGLIMLILAIIIIPIFNIVGWLLSQKSSISENQMPIGFLALFNKPND
jgi:SAM-dependent methyltransferase